MTSGQRDNAAFQRWRGFGVVEGGLSRLSSSRPALEVPNHGSTWVRELTGRLNHLTSLDRGWDGYEGQSVSYTCANFAAGLLETICVPTLPAPSLVPGADGTIQIEWHLLGYDIEIDVLGANSVHATRYSHANDLEEAADLQSDFSVLVDWMDDLERAREQEQVAYA